MKKYIAILLIVLAAAGCSSSKTNAQKQAEVTVTQFDYKAYTRGSNKEVVVTRHKIKVDELRLGKKIEAVYPLSVDNWNKLVSLAKQVSLEKLETLNVPSKDHQFDGAMAANLMVTTDTGTYQSATFDDGNPPAEIKALIEEIIGISGVGKIEVKE